MLVPELLKALQLREDTPLSVLDRIVSSRVRCPACTCGQPIDLGERMYETLDRLVGIGSYM